MRLLKHLCERGFRFAPCPVGDGFADDGREMLLVLIRTVVPGMALAVDGRYTYPAADGPTRLCQI